MQINLNARLVVRLLFLCIGLLTIGNIFGQYARIYLGDDFFFGMVPLFDMDRERCLPTFFSGALLAACSALLCVVGVCERRVDGKFISHWFLLSAIFLFLTADELFSIHEKLNFPIRDALGVGGVFYWPWVIPYSFALLVFVAYFAKFLLALPHYVRILFILSGIVFVSGAMGIEMLSASYVDRFGSSDFIYKGLLVSLEEVLEMVGATMFLYAISFYLTARFENINFTLVNTCPVKEARGAAELSPVLQMGDLKL